MLNSLFCRIKHALTQGFTVCHCAYKFIFVSDIVHEKYSVLFFFRLPATTDRSPVVNGRQAEKYEYWMIKQLIHRFYVTVSRKIANYGIS